MQKIEKQERQMLKQHCKLTQGQIKPQKIHKIKMTDNSATGEDSTVDVHLPPHSSGKAKHPSQIKISSKHRTAITEPSIGDPLPGSQATVKVNGHMPDPGNIGICEFLIEGAPNPADLEGIEEDQLLKYNKIYKTN